MAHVRFDINSMLPLCAQVELWTYTWTSALGIAPMGIICVYLGT